jgi:hypothetical protein
MLRITLAAAAASFALFGAAASDAAPLDRPPFDVGGGPIEPGVLDPVNPCIRHPELCDPVEPPPNPCLENPELCEPQPPEDPCDLAPRLCDPFPVDPCLLSPTNCEEPPVAEPPVQTFSHALAGSARVRVGGAKTTEAYTLQLNFDTAARTFLAMDGDGTLYSGNLAPKGTKGVKFSLFLDDASADVLAAVVADRGIAASGSPGGTLLGSSAKLKLWLNEDGSVSLKIKSQVLVSGVGEIVFKANLVSQ